MVQYKSRPFMVACVTGIIALHFLDAFKQTAKKITIKRWCRSYFLILITDDDVRHACK